MARWYPLGPNFATPYNPFFKANAYFQLIKIILYNKLHGHEIASLPVKRLPVSHIVQHSNSSQGPIWEIRF